MNRHKVCVWFCRSCLRTWSRRCCDRPSGDGHDYAGMFTFQQDDLVPLCESGYFQLQAAGLEVVSEVLSSQALLIASKSSKHPAIVELIRKRIVGYMTATKYDRIDTFIWDYFPMFHY